MSQSPITLVQGAASRTNYCLRTPDRDKVLPKGLGYTSHVFANDVYGLVRGEGFEKLRLAGEQLTQNGKKGKVPRIHARAEAVRVRKVLNQLTRSGIIPHALALHGGDAEHATQWILEQVTTEEMIQDAGDGAGKKDGRVRQQAQRLAKASQQATNALGKQAGAAHAQLMRKILRIDELLPRVRGIYTFASHRGARLQPIQHPEHTLDIRPLRSYSELRQVPATFWLQDEALIEHKLMTRGVPVIQHYRIIPEPEKFVLLLDVSGSMQGGGTAGFSGEEWGTAHAVALLEAAQEGGNEVVFIRFDGDTHPPVVGDAARVLRDVWTCKFSGGGTDIQGALDTASTVEGAKRVVLISDGESHLRGERLPIPLDTILIGKGGKRGEDTTLQKLSDRFYTI